MDSKIELRRLRPDEWDAAARLVHESTNAWYEEHFGRSVFTGDPSNCLVFPEVYEALDPGCCIVAEDTAMGRLAGSFNRMIDALATSRDQQQRLVMDAGHELRTPLTSLRACWR